MLLCHAFKHCFVKYMAGVMCLDFAYVIYHKLLVLATGVTG